MKKKLFFLLRCLISGFFLVLLFGIMRPHLHDLSITLQSVDKRFFLAGIALYIIASIIFAERYRRILAGQKVFLSVPESIQLTFIAFFFNNFLPTAVGGDLVKAYYVARRHNKRVEAFSSILVDRLIGLVPLVSMALIALLITFHSGTDRAVLWFMLLFSGALALLVLFFLHPQGETCVRLFMLPFRRFQRFVKKINQFYQAISHYRTCGKIVFQALFLTFIAQAVMIFIVYLLARSLLIPPAIHYFFLAVPIVFILSMMPSLNGLGVREGAFVYLFQSTMGTEKAMALALLWLGVYYAVSSIGGVVYFFMNKTPQPSG